MEPEPHNEGLSFKYADELSDVLRSGLVEFRKSAIGRAFRTINGDAPWSITKATAPKDTD